MRRLLVSTVAILALVAGAVVATALPAGAATNITATSVALADGADCSDASLDLGMVSGTIDTETGAATNAAGDVLQDFSQNSSLSDTDGVVDGYGISLSADQVDGTLIGSYASIGTAPLSAATAAEWFVLYRCGTDGTNIVVSTCFGDLGSCPQTAAEALANAFGADLEPNVVDPGGAFTVAGVGCFDQLAGAVLFDGGTALGVGDTVGPTPDGSFSIPLVVPATVDPGTALTVQVDCGSEEGGVDFSVDLPLQVRAAATPTTVGPADPTEVAPAFTG